MQLIVKTKGSQPIDEKDRLWTEEKFLKLKKLLPDAAVVEVTLEDMFGPKGGPDKRIVVVAELPHATEAFHLEETDLNFRKAATTARDRFERYLKKYRDRTKTDHRFPRKYWIQNLVDRFKK